MTQSDREVMRSSPAIRQPSRPEVCQQRQTPSHDDGGSDIRIDRLEISALRVKWRQLYGDAPPPRVGRDLLELAVAWHEQAQRGAGLSPWARAAIERMKADIKDGKLPSENAGNHKKPTPGTTFIREWNGTTHHVLVLDSGYAYEGRVWRSLSQIAGEITGARWNGPAFFGLRSKKRQQ